MRNITLKFVRSGGLSLIRLLMAVSAISVFSLVGLGLYTWQLSQEVSALKAASGDSAVSSLINQTQPDPLSGSLFGSNPGAASVFGNAPSVADPFQQMEVFRQQMDSMMNSFFGSASPSISGVPGMSNTPGHSLFGTDPFVSMGLNQPNLSLRETDSALEVVIPVQDGQQFELTTDVEQDRLTVAGTLSWSSQDSGNGMVSSRRSSSQFSRTIMLPDNVDPAGLTTEHRGDEIVITLPKA